MLGMMQVSKRVPVDDPFVLNCVRGIYLASNVIIALIYFYVQLQINKKKGRSFLYSNSTALPQFIHLNAMLTSCAVLQT